MVDDWLSLHHAHSCNYEKYSSGAQQWKWLHTVVPAVNLYTATSLQESSDIGISRRLAPQLVPLQVGVVGGVDEIVREWLCHVLIYCLMLRINGRVVSAS